MRRAILPLLLALAAAPGCLASEISLTVTLLRGGLYVVEDPFYSKENSLVYVGRRHVTVIGATWSPAIARQLGERIRAITSLPIAEVVNTNYHPDRAGGNAYFREIGADVIATRRTHDLMKFDWDRVIRWTQRGVPDYPSIPPVLPNVVKRGDFRLQKGRIRVFHIGESHTPDGVFVYFPDERVLYGGCILKERLGNLEFANLAEYPKTLQRLRARKLPIDTIVAGHWTPLHGPELVDQYLELLKAETR